MGNVIALTDGAQAVQRTYQVDAWGQLVGGSDLRPFSNADRARFKGALWLGPEADLYYMRARWYEPQSGRFLSEDPIGLAGGINPYVYAGDDPVNRSDPLGLDDCEKNADGSYTCPAVVVESGPPQLLPLGYGNDRGAMSLGLLTTFPVSIIPPKPLGPKGPSCKAELFDTAIAIGAQVAQVGIFKGLARWSRSGVLTRAARYAGGNRMPLMASRMNGRATTEALAGGMQYVGGLTLTAAQGVEAWYNDAPWWYDAMKFVPFFGMGMEIGEATNVCLLN